MEIKDRQVYVRGPHDVLEALFNSAVAGIERGHSCWMGVVETTGATGSYGRQDEVRLQVRDKVKMVDARLIVPFAIEIVARQHGLEDRLPALSVRYPDDVEAEVDGPGT